MPRGNATLLLLGKITKALSSGKPLEAILKSLARDVAQFLKAESCAIMLIDDQRRELLFKEAHGLPKAELDRIRFRMGEGVAGWVAQKQEPACVPDVSRDARFKAFPDQSTKIVSLLCVPLMLRGRVLGVVCVNSKRRRAFGREEQMILEHLAAHTVLEIENHRLYELSVTDALTQLFNRRYFLRRLEDEIGRAERVGESLAVCIGDLNRFKQINDTLGHAAGDEVLVTVARRFRQKLRAYDIAARYGGDEFAFLFLDSDRSKVESIARRLAESLEEPLPSGRITASFGFAIYPDDGEDAKSLLAKADDALYAAKKRSSRSS